MTKYDKEEYYGKGKDFNELLEGTQRQINEARKQSLEAGKRDLIALTDSIKALAQATAEIVENHNYINNTLGITEEENKIYDTFIINKFKIELETKRITEKELKLLYWDNVDVFMQGFENISLLILLGNGKYKEYLEFNEENEAETMTYTEYLEQVQKITMSDLQLTQVIEYWETTPLKEIVKDKLKIKDISEFFKFYQNPVTNDLAKSRMYPKPSELNYSGTTAIIQGKKELKVIINDYDNLVIKKSETAKMLLDVLILKLTNSTHKTATIQLTLSEYMEIRDLKDAKESRKQIKKDMKILNSTSLDIVEYAKKRNIKNLKVEKGDFKEIGIGANNYGIVNGIIEFQFSEPFYKLINNTFIMSLPKEYFKTNLKLNPHTPALIRTISEHKNMNYGKDNADIMSVKSLLESLPRLPNPKETKKKKEKIIIPFERDLNNINIFDWYYCEPGGKRKEKPKNYNQFENSLICFNWKKYPKRLKKEISK